MQQPVQIAETYPWSVQPRIIDGCTMWVAWSAYDGYTSSAYHEYDDAEAVMHGFIQAAEAEKRLRDSRASTRARVTAAEKRSSRQGCRQSRRRAAPLHDDPPEYPLFSL